MASPPTIDADPDMPLLYALRNDLGLNNPQFGCGLAQCGACTVHLDGEPVRSCVMPVSRRRGQDRHDDRGLGTPEKPHPVQQAYVDEQVPQCGYCVNGWIMTAAALAEDEPEGHRRADSRCDSPASSAAAARTCRSCARSSAPQAR